jgi:hypothetical protein
MAAPIRHQLADLIAAVDQLPDRARDRIETALVEVRRDVAVQELWRLIDPDGTRPRCNVATDLSDRLKRFKDTAWPRIRDGHRPPKDRVESLLCDLAIDPTCPQSWRRLKDLLD